MILLDRVTSQFGPLIRVYVATHTVSWVEPVRYNYVGREGGYTMHKDGVHEGAVIHFTNKDKITVQHSAQFVAEAVEGEGVL